ncbi:MAG: glycerol-3-phosphate acyltransferase [Limisphaerales bacterium]
MNATFVLALLLCYAIGCVVTAWYLVRWRTGSDLRALHSGTTGARNAGRVLGRWGFAIVALLDGLRGLLAMVLAASFGLREWWLTAAGLAVLAGHLWPVQLGFHGGKGIAVSVGVFIWLLPLRTVPDWTLALAMLALVLWSHRSDLRARFQAKPPQ